MADGSGKTDIGQYAVNWSSISNGKPSQSSQDASLIAIYNQVEFSSAIILIIFSPITVFTNGLFLVALFQDSLKCFRKSPSTFFVAGLSIADFITGLLVEPSFAIHYIVRYFVVNQDILEMTRMIYTIGGALSTIAISTSFVIVLAMSLSQYIAISYPHKYKTIVTGKRVIRLVGFSGLYFLAFSLLQLTGISRKRFLLLDVILHPTLISFLLTVVLILMRKAFQKRVSQPARKRTHISSAKGTCSSRNQDRDDLEGTTSLNIRPTSANSNSSGIQVSPSRQSPLLSKSSGQEEMSCKRHVHHNNNIAKKSAGARLTQIETVHEDFDDQPKDIRNGDESNTARSSRGITIEPMRKIKTDTEVVEIMNGLHGLDQNTALTPENVQEDGKTSQVSQQLLSAGLKRLRHSFYRQPSRRKPHVERQFAIMSFYLAAILLLSSLSHTVVFYVFLLRKPKSIAEDVYVNIALRITDLMLFFKVLLDAFIYAWRLPAYRKSLVRTICCGRIQLAADV